MSKYNWVSGSVKMPAEQCWIKTERQGQTRRIKIHVDCNHANTSFISPSIVRLPFSFPLLHSWMRKFMQNKTQNACKRCLSTSTIAYYVHNEQYLYRPRFPTVQLENPLGCDFVDTVCSHIGCGKHRKFAHTHTHTLGCMYSEFVVTI